MTRSRNLTLALTILCALAMLLAVATAVAHPDPTDAKFERDRQAILAMAGEFRVDFKFQETVAVEPGYELKDPYHSTATEFVEVIEDAGDFISLQHVLVLHPADGGEPRVVKHWRQDWRYEDTKLNEFRGHRTWELVELAPAQVKGKWTQAVYQVDDSPRYAGLAAWEHAPNAATWEPPVSWRPLPRRDATTPGR